MPPLCMLCEHYRLKYNIYLLNLHIATPHFVYASCALAMNINLILSAHMYQCWKFSLIYKTCLIGVAACSINIQPFMERNACLDALATLLFRTFMLELCRITLQSFHNFWSEIGQICQIFFCQSFPPYGMSELV